MSRGRRKEPILGYVTTKKRIQAEGLSNQPFPCLLHLTLNNPSFIPFSFIPFNNHSFIPTLSSRFLSSLSITTLWSLCPSEPVRVRASRSRTEGTWSTRCWIFWAAWGRPAPTRGRPSSRNCRREPPSSGSPSRPTKYSWACRITKTSTAKGRISVWVWSHLFVC